MLPLRRMPPGHLRIRAPRCRLLRGEKRPKAKSHHRSFAGGFPPQVSQPSVSESPFRVIDLIRKTRDAGASSPAEIEYLVAGCTQGSIPDYQMAAWLMAVVLRGMTRGETAALTHAMLHSGEVLDTSFLSAEQV